MPFYEYRRADGTTFEVLQKMSDPQLTEDPDTGEPVQRVFHPIAVHFKGKGFYNTDYGTKNRERETAAQEGASKGDGKGAAKGEAKPADAPSGDSASKPASGSSESSSTSKAPSGA